MKVFRIVALAAFFAGTSAVLASPAYADELIGTYSATASDETGVSDPATWQLTPCGPDCRTLVWGVSTEEMHRQGTTWTSTDAKGCTTIVDQNSLAGTFQCPGDSVLNVQAVKVA